VLANSDRVEWDATVFALTLADITDSRTDEDQSHRRIVASASVGQSWTSAVFVAFWRPYEIAHSFEIFGIEASRRNPASYDRNSGGPCGSKNSHGARSAPSPCFGSPPTGGVSTVSLVRLPAMDKRVEAQLENVLAAVRKGRLVAPAGLVARLEGAVIAAKVLAHRQQRAGESRD
jgi:hypothetical protein